jgi:hypothetical protein
MKTLFKTLTTALFSLLGLWLLATLTSGEDAVAPLEWGLSS